MVCKSESYTFYFTLYYCVILRPGPRVGDHTEDERPQNISLLFLNHGLNNAKKEHCSVCEIAFADHKANIYLIH